MRWLSGPLEIAKRQKTEGFTAQARQVLEYWHTAPALEMIQGSPVNCLVVSWAAGLPEDAEQQRSLGPLVGAARQRNLDVVGWVEGKVDANAAIASAKAAGLTAVAIQGFTGKSDFQVLPWGDRSNAPWKTTAPVLPITDGVWPGIAGRAAGAQRDTTAAGPTSNLPWLDSNGWFIQFGRAKTQTPLWIMFDPPGKGEVVPARSYQTAVCDVAVAGGQWVVSLDDAFRAGLAGKDASAKEAWAGLVSALSFFQKHPEWKTYKSMGALGVVSDFSGDNYDFGGEILNALSRRDFLCTAICDTGKALPSLAGLKVILRADSQAPSAAVKASLLAYVQQGGTLVTGSKWGASGVAGTSKSPNFNVRSLGKGRIAIAKEDTGDPWDFVTKAQAFISQADRTAKLFNASASGGFRYSASPDRKRALLQILSYSSYGGRGGGAGRAGGGAPATVPLSSMVTAWTRDKYRTARIWTLEAAGPGTIEVAKADAGGTDYYLPAMSAYLALDLEV
jgi:hypothetical protein